ncbi:hypothetical protein [Nocardia sp. NPDC059691]
MEFLRFAIPAFVAAAVVTVIPRLGAAESPLGAAAVRPGPVLPEPIN